MAGLNREASRQRSCQADDTKTLTSFPEPPLTASPANQLGHDGLSGLLYGSGPSMFDDNHAFKADDPQALSAAPADVLQSVADHHGAVFLIQRLSAALAERDAQITALRRLCEDYKVPADRVEDTTSRVKQAEARRLSLAAASEDLAVSGSNTSNSSVSQTAQKPSNGNNDTIKAKRKPTDNYGTIKNLTRMFAGSGKPSRPSDVTSPTSSRAASIAPSTRERPQSIDGCSMDAQSIDSATWTSALNNVISGGKRRDSRTLREPVEMNTRFDPEQLPPTLATRPKDRGEAEWNQYINKLNKARELSDIHEEEGMFIGMAHFGREGATGQRKMKALIELVVEIGVPMSLRHNIWMELSNTLSMKRPDAYDYYLSLRENDDPAEIDAILKDVPRTLTRQYDFYVDKGYQRLKNLLIAFIGKYEGLGYTQGLNMIAGHLLLAIPAEEDAFWVLCNMVDNFFPPNYFARNTAMSGPLADNIVLRQYIREIMPQLATHLDELEIPDDHTVPLAWFLTAFADLMPTPVLLRVWDVWLCIPNQQCFIFNVALALLAQHADQIMEMEETGEYYSFKYKVPEDPQKVDELVKQAFMYRKRLEHAGEKRAMEVKKLRKSASTEALYAND